MKTIRQPKSDDGRDERPLYTIKAPGADEGSGKKTVVVVFLVIALLAAAAVVGWYSIGRGGSDSPAATTQATPAPPSTIGPTAAAPEVLSALAGGLGHTVYWAGPMQGKTLEYTKTSNGAVYIRYLPKGVAIGDRRANWLIVATYPYLNAFKAIQAVTKGTKLKLPGGGIARVDPANPQSVHFAFPGVDFQGEVYDRSGKRALAMATSGKIEPIPPSG